MAYVIIAEIVVLFGLAGASVFCWFLIRARPAMNENEALTPAVDGSMCALASLAMLGVVAVTFLAWWGWMTFMAP